ncbi:MAG: PH domain-containing protein [Thermomicrobium sp.]|nr:PH domain-containing protein [Thermomicrobium sp.]
MRGPVLVRYRARAAPSAGGLIGLGLLLVLTATAVLALLSLLGLTHSALPLAGLWLVFLTSGAGALLVGYLLAGYFSLGYDVTDTAIRIRWGGRIEEVPLDQLTYVGPAAPYLGGALRQWQPFWPGFYVGWYRSPFGRVRVIATQPISRQLLLSTTTGHWAISPAQPVVFLDQVAAARRQRAAAAREATIVGREQLAAAGWTAAFPTVGDAVEPRVASGRFPVLRSALVRDRVALGLVVASLVLLGGLVGFLLLRSAQFPETLVLHWNASGLPDRIGTRRDLWLLPIVAAIVTIANIALAFLTESLERFAAWLLLSGTVVVLVLIWVAVVTITF